MKRKESTTDNHQLNNNKNMECDDNLENPKKKIQKQDPIQKEQKYDRQLRLWGNDGQKALENASVCLINATATATETLKCLVLPGVAKFYIFKGSAPSKKIISFQLKIVEICLFLSIDEFIILISI